MPMMPATTGPELIPIRNVKLVPVEVVGGDVVPDAERQLGDSFGVVGAGDRDAGRRPCTRRRRF